MGVQCRVVNVNRFGVPGLTDETVSRLSGVCRPPRSQRRPLEQQCRPAFLRPDAGEVVVTHPSRSSGPQRRVVAILQQQFDLRLERLYLRRGRVGLGRSDTTMRVKVGDSAQTVLEMIEAVLQTPADVGDHLRERFMPEQRWDIVQHRTHQERCRNEVAVREAGVDLAAQPNEKRDVEVRRMCARELLDEARIDEPRATADSERTVVRTLKRGVDVGQQRIELCACIIGGVDRVHTHVDGFQPCRLRLGEERSREPLNLHEHVSVASRDSRLLIRVVARPAEAKGPGGVDHLRQSGLLRHVHLPLGRITTKLSGRPTASAAPLLVGPLKRWVGRRLVRTDSAAPATGHSGHPSEALQ